MSELFLVLEKMEPKHKPHFKILYEACIEETGIKASDSFVHSLYNINKSYGIIAFDVYGNPVGYVLYTISDDHPLFLINFYTHRKFRQEKIMSRLLSYIFYYEKPKLMSTIVGETFLEVQLFLKSLKFRCVRIVHNTKPNSDNFVFITNNWNPINRLSSYAPNMF